MNKRMKAHYDVVIIGSGAAGLTLALHLPNHLSVAMICKESPLESSSYYAQGGVAAVLDEYDSIQAHVDDTLIAGDGLCDLDAVSFVVEQSPSIIDWLVDLGVDFDTRVSKSGRAEFHLTQEGGHRHRRVIHAADATGREITERLSDALGRRSNTDFLTNHIAIDLITGNQLGESNKAVRGVYTLDLNTLSAHTFSCNHLVLATGGASKVYLYTSNPDTASGDGIAMAWRAGCRVANLEFNQFHPTCLYHPSARSFLISEALRGEGARLLLPDGSPFMQKFDDRGELASRDIVARAIDFEMKRLGCDHVLLDISHEPSDKIRQHFPNIYEKCLAHGFDLTQGPIPIVPAAHYTCGGVVTDLAGRTDIQNLYAIGEVSYTGLHGANRMASNSLLECMVFGRSTAAAILGDRPTLPTTNDIPAWDASQVSRSSEDILLAHNWDELRRLMWDYVGIVRSNRRLLRAQRRIQLLQQEINDYYAHHTVNRDLLELRNLAQVAELIVRSALSRKESRGLHFNVDYPEAMETAETTILTPSNYMP
jgi:L-aspartate oxidase